MWLNVSMTVRQKDLKTGLLPVNAVNQLWRVSSLKTPA
jgi:hypothetical protein